MQCLAAGLGLGDSCTGVRQHSVLRQRHAARRSFTAATTCMGTPACLHSPASGHVAARRSAGSGRQPRTACTAIGRKKVEEPIDVPEEEEYVVEVRLNCCAHANA